MNNFFSYVFQDAKKGIKGYIKSQLILILVSFVILFIGFKIIGIEHGVLKATGIALLDSLPIIGSGIIMIPWAIYKFIVGYKSIAFEIAILYLFLTIIKQILQPIIIGDSIGLRPIYTFISAGIGSLIIGPLGVLIGPIVAVILKSTLKYKEFILDDIKKKELKKNNEFIDAKYEEKSKDT